MATRKRRRRALRASPNTGLVVASPVAAPAAHSNDAPHLDREQRALLAEALRRADETRDVMEGALVSYGRWILINVFGDDAGAALDDKSENPVWRTLLARAGGPTLRLSRHLLYVALQIAARDKRIADDTWRLLEPGRKELLLPLGDEAEMRSAAHHVVSMKLTQRATQAYVRNLLAERGTPARQRFTPARARAHVHRVFGQFSDGEFVRGLGAQLARLEPGDRTQVRKEIASLLETLRRLRDKLE